MGGKKTLLSHYSRNYKYDLVRFIDYVEPNKKMYVRRRLVYRKKIVSIILTGGDDRVRAGNRLESGRSNPPREKNYNRSIDFRLSYLIG